MLYFLRLAVSVFCPLASYRRFRTPLHPHFVFTMCAVFLLPMGAVVSPEVPAYVQSLRYSDAAGVAKDEMIVLGFLLALFAGTLLLPQVTFKNTTAVVTRSLKLTKSSASTLGAIGLLILGLEVGMQLYTCDWSPSVWFEYTIGPRFGRPWLGGYIGGTDFMFALIGNMFFASTLLLPLALAGTRGLMRLAVVCGEVIILFIFICNGSRTPVALTALVILLLWHFHAPNRAARITGHILIVSALVVVTAVMLAFRTQGYAASGARDGEPYEIKYAQDDNYYQVVRVMCLADEGNAANLNAATLLTSAVVNPIPRYFWPNKPLLGQDYFGDWKAFYVTISFVGECIAMFGKWLGLAVALMFGLVYYQLLVWAYKLITREFGVAAYLTTCFYVYMAERSIQNIGMNAVILILVLSLYFWFQQQPSSPARRRARHPAQTALDTLGQA
jgi:hypothetical protein